MLADVSPAPMLPTEPIDTAASDSYAQDVREHHLPVETAARLQQLAEACDVPLVAAAGTCLAVVAARLTREHGALLLVDVAEAASTLVQLECDGDASLKSLVSKVADQLDGTHRLDVALEATSLIECGPQSWRQSTWPIGIAVRTTSEPPRRIHAALTLALHPSGGGAAFAYDGRSIAGETVSRIAERLARCAAVPLSGSLNEHSLMGEAEAHFVSVRCNRTARPRMAHPGITEAFCEAATQHPHAVALAGTYSGEKDVQYGELTVASDALAAALHASSSWVMSSGMQLVALIFDRSVAMVVAILGVLKAGAGFVPIEPTFPRARVEEMILEASPLAVLLGAQPFAERLLAADSAPLVAVASADGSLAALALDSKGTWSPVTVDRAETISGHESRCFQCSSR